MEDQTFYCKASISVTNFLQESRRAYHSSRIHEGNDISLFSDLMNYSPFDAVKTRLILYSLDPNRHNGATTSVFNIVSK